ncbi:MAG: hypothetical protein HGB28_02255 [Oscillochloris sp.]|nr:hypothetical protein [Oscillochloris sp.]
MSRTTDANGQVTLWLLPTRPGAAASQLYTLTAYPPTGSPFATFSLPNIAVSGNQELVVALQFIHAPPVTTATATPQPRASGSYPGPVTVALAATSGYPITATSYSVDGGPTLTYGAPFTISGDGAHTLRYWSTDSAGVYEAPRTLALTIATNRAPSVDAGGPYHVIVGQSLTLSGAATDPDGDPLTYAWDLDADGSFETLGQTATFSALGRRVGSAQPVSFRACDPYSACPQAATTVAIESDLRITTASPLPAGLVDAPYSVTFAAAGGTPPYTWAVAPDSALPPGLILDPASGALSGTPTTAGAFGFRIQVTDSDGSTARGDYAIDSPPSDGRIGGRYKGRVAPAPDCTTYALATAALPDGLALNQATGEISGTPTASGIYTFTVGCTTRAGQTATKEFTITILNPLPVLTSLSPTTARASGGDLTLTLHGSGFLSSSTVRWGGESRLTTYVSGSELRAAILATDLAAAGSAEVTVFNPAPGGGVSNALSFTTTAPNQLPTASAGGPYTAIVGRSVTLNGTGEDLDGDLLTYAWDLDGNGSFETPGQQASFSALGRLPGTQPVRLQVCDSQGACATDGTSVEIVSDLRITTASPLPSALVDAPYSVTFEAAGGTPPYTWDTAPGSKLPDGLSLDHVSGVLSGTPTTAGEFRFAIRVTDNLGTTVGGDYYIDPPPPPGNAGNPYQQPIVITPPSSGGACASYALFAGALPPGMSLNESTGVISGTPLDGGDYAFTVACTTSGGQTATKSFSILISNPAPTLDSLDPAHAPAAGPALTLTLRGSGFVRSSTARWAGSDRPTSYVSSTEIQVTISAGDLAAATVVDLTISNPTPGGGVSNALPFSVLAQPPALSLPEAPPAQYSDHLAVTITAADADTAGADLSFSATGLPAGLALTDNGDGSATISGVVLAPVGSYAAQISVRDPSGLSASGELAFVIAPEAATLSYGGDTSATEGAPLTLRAQVAEETDTSPGDLTQAALFFDLTDSAGATTSYGPVAVAADGTASDALPAGLPAGDYTMVVRLDPSGGFYAAPASAPASLHIQAPPPVGPTCNGVPATIVGTARRDVIRGTPGADVIVGLGGNDLIDGRGGNDMICGGDGNDTLDGGAGNDVLYGGSGNDVLRGDHTDDSGDRRYGGEHDGDCHGHPAPIGGNDKLFGEEGNDRLFGDAGNDTLDGGVGSDQIDGGAGDVDQLLGGDGNDRLIDEDGASAAHGGAGRDTLDITLRAGWRDANGQPRFVGALSGGYGDDRVTLTLLDRRAFVIDISGDERDVPPSALEGKRDHLNLRGTRVSRDSQIIKFER